MSVRMRLLIMAVLLGVAVAPLAHARDWRGQRGDYGGDYHHDRRGGDAGAAVIGGLLGLGLGAAIASQGGYAAPPPAYYGAPPGYYASPPPAVYYGY